MCLRAADRSWCFALLAPADKSPAFPAPACSALLSFRNHGALWWSSTRMAARDSSTRNTRQEGTQRQCSDGNVCCIAQHLTHLACNALCASPCRKYARHGSYAPPTSGSPSSGGHSCSAGATRRAQSLSAAECSAASLQSAAQLYSWCGGISALAWWQLPTRHRLPPCRSTTSPFVSLVRCKALRPTCTRWGTGG